MTSPTGAAPGHPVDDGWAAGDPTTLLSSAGRNQPVGDARVVGGTVTASARRAAAAVPGGWDVDAALGVVRDGYLQSHGRSPLDGATSAAPGEDDEPRAHRGQDTPRIRWLVSWRAAAAASVVVVLAAGSVAIRASTRAAGPAVDIPAAAVTAASDAVPQDGGGASSPHATADPAVTPSTGSVVVHVVGAVAAPGVVRLSDGARVADVLAAAGGASPDADLSTVNLARVVVDGEQVVVLRVGELPAAPAPAAHAGGASSDAAAPAGLVDLNAADVTALDALPGIGPVLAQRIVEHRAEQPFTTVDELADVRGIGPALLENIRASVRV